MSDRKHFQDLQFDFAAHIRNPQNTPAPTNIEDRRMAIYRDLFFNNLSSLLSGTFPVLKKVIGKSAWEGLIRDFMIEHRCHTPYFHQVSEEFLAYLQQERAPDNEDPPFLFELAHYEWVELAMTLEDDPEDILGVDPSGDLLENIPVLSPLAWRLGYHYAVHRISLDYQPTEPEQQPVHLLINRDADDKVNFTEINPVTARLLELMEEDRFSGREILSKIAAELGEQDPASTIHAGEKILARLRDSRVVLGTRDAGQE